jgi:Raf kinase inhibitor-like YbhB/YbcL family protein
LPRENCNARAGTRDADENAMHTRFVMLAIAATALASGAAGAQSVAKLTVSSPAFTDRSAIPAKYTCDGEGKSPPLAWSRLPLGTQSVAVVVDDPDAPHGTFVHWILFDVPSNTNALGEGSVPPVAMQGRNGTGQVGWTPPCPPNGTHHYHFKVYALSSPLTLSQPTADELVRAARGRVIAQGELVGTYAR